MVEGRTAYSTDVIFLPEPNEVECAISAHLYATGLPAEEQGIDKSLWVANPARPDYCTYKRLNHYLTELGGVASIFQWCR